MKKMFVFNVQGSKKWIGGLYYKRNIVFSLLQNDYIKRNFKIVLLINKDNKELFSFVKDKNVDILVYESKLEYLLKVVYCYFKTTYKIAYSCFLRISKPFIHKHIYWIPDFQDKYYPEFFQEEEIIKRNKSINNIIEKREPIIFSSYNAKQDFFKYYLKNNDYDTCVFPFVSYIEPEIKSMTAEMRKKSLLKYHLEPKKYIFITNQFWQHKNHKVVFEMLKLAKNQNRLKNIKFVFTGELEDYRNSEYINSIKEIIKNNKLEEIISILGFIDRIEQLILMKESLLVIQPSLFEGWGTVLEDAKVLDKTVLLSKIPVHCEQMNEKCHLFNPYDPNDLLKKLEEVISTIPEENIEEGIRDMYARAREYTEEFEKFLKEKIS